MFDKSGTDWGASEVNKQKGVLVDIFDSDGRYVDSFYLKLSGQLDAESLLYKPVELSGEILYISEKNEDETISIKKYRLIDPK